MDKQIATALSVVRMRLAASAKPVPPHPARAHIHRHETVGDAVADAVVAGMGSWRFIIIQTVVVVFWIAGNVFGWQHHWDAYPFILLNLVFSTQAAYASPLILMAANRTAAKDRKRDDTEAAEVDKLFQINQQQLDILHGQDAILAELKALAARQDEPAAPVPAAPAGTVGGGVALGGGIAPVKRSHRAKAQAKEPTA